VDSPELVNQDPYRGGWFVQFIMEDPDELDDLMDAKAYAKYAEELLEEGEQ
jgi:glycine cleavage system H protein